MTLRGTTPLLMHNPRMVDPEFGLNREIKKLTSKRTKTEADLADIERLEWYGGLYEEDGVIVQPTSKPRKSLVNTARVRKLGKTMERAIIMVERVVPLEYDGPKDIDDVYADKRFHSRLSVGISKKRVMRVRPQFFPWAMTVRGVFLTDAGLEFDDLCDLAESAGRIEGIGDNRVNGYGRFIAEVSEA